jgi:hypothetical protein
MMYVRQLSNCPIGRHGQRNMVLMPAHAMYPEGRIHLIDRAEPPLMLLEENTAIGSLFSYVWKLASDRFNVGVDGEVLSVEDENNPTLIITSGEGESALYKFMDLDREKIFLGYEITRHTLEEAKYKFDQNNIQFCVVLIPSKASAYYNYLHDDKHQLHDSYYKMVENEKILVERLSSIMDELSIKYIDARPYVLRYASLISQRLCICFLLMVTLLNPDPMLMQR